mmetsp:Transcript_3202/g.4540  ORF Transcript_3202/g.4540 Transcript_3202/m.4540 type:complete len:199 (-) Transcript_3202:161-757(-)
MSLRTANHGMVPVRQPRPQDRFKPGEGERMTPYKGREMFIRARWLKGNGDYRVLTKQAMLIAAARMELNDITMPSEGGVSQQYIMEDLRARKVTAQSKLDELYQGKKPIPMKALKGERGLHSTIEKVKRSTLQKRSRGVLGGGLSTRYFTLDGGVLKSYKSMAEKAKATKIYQLKLAKASVENSSERRGNFQLLLPVD